MARRKARISKRQAMAEKWRPLYEAADRIKKLAPWKWIMEDEIFGIQDPETGEIGFVSVMGMLGEHLSIAVYLGINAVNQFWRLEEIADSDDSWEIASRLFLIPHLQVSFESRDMVEKEDLGIMRRLKLNYRGRNAYPVFREIRPGCLPWQMEAAHIPFLTHVLEQTIDVASRCQEDEYLLYPDNVDGNEGYLLRVPEKQNGEIIWKDEIRPIPDPEDRLIAVNIDPDSFAALQDVPRVGNSVEIDLFMTMMPVQDKRDERPYFPFTLLIVDADSGMILSHDLLSPLPSIDNMYSEVPQRMINLLLRNNMLPYEVHTQSFLMTQLLAPLFAQLETRVIRRPSLPLLNEAKTSMQEYTRTGFR